MRISRHFCNTNLSIWKCEVKNTGINHAVEVGLHEAFRVPACLLKKPWESPQAYRQSSHSGGDNVPKLSKPASIWLFSESQHCTSKSSYTGMHACWDSETRGRVTRASHLKDFALHLTTATTPQEEHLKYTALWRQSRIQGTKGDHILLREVFSIEKLLERQHPRDLIKSKGSSKLPDHWTILPSQKNTLNRHSLGCYGEQKRSKCNKKQGDWKINDVLGRNKM